MTPSQWQIQDAVAMPDRFVQAVQQYVQPDVQPDANGTSGQYVAQLLWQRGWRDPAALAGFIDPNLYQPTGPFAFGQEMEWAIERLRRAWSDQESVAIWGDFDADGVTATAVLWQGLGQFFALDRQLTYVIPNRLRESHGLSIAGIDALADQGYRLIVTCDTGSTNLAEIAHAQQLGMEVIVTDHHTLPVERPPVVALINPRALPSEHPLAHLSGVAVAYKLVEALYETLPTVPQRPLTDLLDLVAIGLIADLVDLKGDCRYLAQRGIEKLQQNQTLKPSPRPGISKLLEFCQRNGDRPTDISFGIGPRINAISRIQGDARFCVELLTSQDVDRCQQLATETELANTRRKALQKDVVQQVKERLAQLDLSTTSVIVLSDPQWSIGILGLVAGQIAQEYGKPTILLTTDLLTTDLLTTESRLQTAASADEVEEEVPEVPEVTKVTKVAEVAEVAKVAEVTKVMARGSARSVNGIDLYELVKHQADLLHSFGGHPLALGLSLPEADLPLFTAAINRQLREQQSQSGLSIAPKIQVDLTVTVAELGKDLFRELKLLEPYGMGNPTPKLLIRNCWFDRVMNRNIKDLRGRKLRYIKTEFELWDDSLHPSSVDRGFPGIWWEHYVEDIPHGRCDAIAELDFNAYQKIYQIRLLAVRSLQEITDSIATTLTDTRPTDWLLDHRPPAPPPATDALQLTVCPADWTELQHWFRKALQSQEKLAIAYPPPTPLDPLDRWQHLVGIAKYLSRTQKTVTRQQLANKLELSDRAIEAGLAALQSCGFTINLNAENLQFTWQNTTATVQTAAPATATASDSTLSDSVSDSTVASPAIAQFIAILQEEQFRRQYFSQVTLTTLQSIASQ